MNNRKVTEELNAIPIRQVAAYLGIAFPRKSSVRCPLPDHDDKNPSFAIHNNGIRWTCYGCGKFGGSIDLVMAYCGLDFMTAKRRLVQMAGISVDQLNRQNRRTVPGKLLVKSTVKKSEPKNIADTDFYEAMSRAYPLKTGGRNYLGRRGLSPRTIAKSRVFEISDASEIMATLIDQFSFERVFLSGVLVKGSTSKSWQCLFPNNGIVFPFFEKGKLTYLQYRTLNDSDKKRRWRNLNFQIPKLYNSDILENPKLNNVAICEGVLDCISGIELGMNSVGIIGVNRSLTDQQITKLQGKTLTILFDWDEAGERRSVELREELARYGISTIRKKRPLDNIKDLNDYLLVRQVDS